MSLRARLLLVLAALSIVGLVAADVATYTSEKSFLTSRVDGTTTTIAHAIETRPLHDLGDIAQGTPGIWIGAVSPGGSVTWSRRAAHSSMWSTV